MAHWRLGRVLRLLGAAEAALSPLTEAQRRFQDLVEAGDTDVGRMAAVAITERGDCLQDLGRLDEAAAAYEDAIERAKSRDDKRSMAVNKGQLGSVRLQQQRYDEALAAYGEARDTFEALGEPGSVAVAWHQIGMVHRHAGQFELAERAYRQALAMRVRQQNRSGEASSLLELGNLYRSMGRLEEAVAFTRQAADIDVTLQDLMSEGIDRNNLADTLITLHRYDEARQELRRAIECRKPFGHAAELWKTWNILHNLEQATGNAPAAAAARQQAVQSYLAYRRDGGESQAPRARLCALIASAIQQGDTTEATQRLAQLAAAEMPPWLQAMLPRLRAILEGHRDPALASDPALDYDDAVELLLLLETLAA